MSAGACDEPLCTTQLTHHTHTDADGRSWCCGPYPYTAPIPAAPVPDPADGLREEIARAIFDAANPITESFPDYWERVAGGKETRGRYRAEADAVLALPRVRALLAAEARVRKVADELDADLDSYGYRIRNGLDPSPGERIRRALDGNR